MRILAILTTCVLLAAASPAIADNAADQDSLDQELLEGLGDDLFDGLDMPDLSTPDEKQPPAGETDPTAPAKEGGAKPAVEPDGEDIGEGPENPLVEIGRQMQTVQDRIGQGQAEDDTLSMQRSIIQQLDDLIEKAKQQQQQQQQQNQNQNQQQQQQQQQQKNQQQQQQQNQQQQNQQQQSQSQQQQQQPQNGGAEPQPQEGDAEQMGQQENEQASESSDEVRDRDYELLPLEARGALIKEVWGQLPERVRQQLQNASVEKFLPKYERLTEDYFRRLAEEEQEGR